MKQLIVDLQSDNANLKSENIQLTKAFNDKDQELKELQLNLQDMQIRLLSIE